MATKTTSRACPFGGAAVVTVLPNAIAAIGDGNCGGDFLRQFADSYRHQTSPNEAAYLGDHVTASSNSTVESAMTCDDVFYIDESVADFTSPSSSPLPSSSLSSLHETTDLTSTVESQSTLSGRRRKHGRTGRGSSSASDADAGVRVPGSGARRNERERNRVRQVNAGFDRLRDHVPQGRRNRKLSKVDTLRAAVEYIAHLQLVLSGRPSSFSQSGMLAAGKISISRSPVSQLQSADGEVLRDINANTVVFNIVDGDGGRKHFSNSVFANEAVAGQYPPVPDESSSSSSASVTELLFQLAASSTPVANENSFPVIVGNENVPLTADYVNPITGNETLYYASRPSLFVSDGVGGRQHVGGRSTGSVPLSSPARDPNYAGCYLSATSAGNDKASALAAEAGSMPSLDGGCIDDRLRDITSWLNS